MQVETWPAFIKRFSAPVVIPHTISELDAMDKVALSELKDTGWYIGGTLKPLKRNKSNVTTRSIIALDADHAPRWESPESLVDTFQDITGTAALAHTTLSHRATSPRMRLLIPLATDIKPSIYEPLARFLAADIGLELFDVTTYQYARIMYWPSCASDADYKFYTADSDTLLDPESYLATKGEWRNWRNWPHGKREGPARAPINKAEDPTTKAGVIGAFCRAYTIPDAISAFKLPYVEITRSRYAYEHGSGGPGAIHYETDNMLCSWHESDPARGVKNAWDLVRIHNYGDLDQGLRADQSIADYPSHQALLRAAMELPEVQQELAQEFFTAEEPGAIDVPAEEDTVSIQNNYDRLEAYIKEHGALDRTTRREVVRDIATARLSKADISTLAMLIKDNHEAPAPDKAAIIREILDTKKQLRSTDGDADLALINEAMKENFNDGAHLRRFARQYWRYAGGVWSTTEDEIIRERVQQTIIGLRDKKDISHLVADVLEDSRTSSIMSSIWQMTCAHVAGFDTSDDPMGLMRLNIAPVMNCRNTEIHFARDGSYETAKHSPEHMLTAQLGISYDPKADTKPWDKFCGLMFYGSDDKPNMKRHLEEVTGYIMQSWRRLACFGVMHGEPWAGKSTYAEILNSLLGRSAANREISRYSGTDKHDTSGLVGKQLLLDEDYPAGTLLPDGFLKKISEQKRLTIDPKFVSQFDFVCRAFPFIITNNWPGVRDHSGAIERRALVWALHTIPTNLRNDDTKHWLLTKGLQGAFKRFVDGFARLYERGDWDVPDECIEARDSWLTGADSVALWASERLVKELDSWLSCAGLHEIYLEWHRRVNPGGRAVGRTEFFTRLRKRLGKEAKLTGVRGWHDYAYKIAEQEEF